VPEPMPTWGLWPATAVALAADAGAVRIGLLGIDLGTPGRPDPTFAPLAGLLGLMTRLVTADPIDCGASGARKRGWRVGPLDELAADRALGPLRVQTRLAASIEERVILARHTRDCLAPIVDRARHILAMGVRARGGDRVNGLENAASELLSWCWDRETRIHLQEGLGLSFLPRLWRTGVDLALGPALWRPIVLATHELVGQAERLDGLVRTVAA